MINHITDEKTVIRYNVEKTLYLFFDEDELEDVNKTLEIKATLEDEVELVDFEIETLFNAGLISKADYKEILQIEDVTKIITLFR